jgi:RES domain-containing protein
MPPPGNAYRLSGTFWHQAGPGWKPLSFADPATVDSRYSPEGAAGAWYGSSQEQGAWAEFLRHFTQAISPAEVKRRMARVRVTDLAVLNLTDANVVRTLGVDPNDLTSDDTSTCQTLARQAVADGYEGILAPSAALPGRRTLAVFQAGMPRLAVEHEDVRRLPSRVLDLVDMIPMPDAVRENIDRWLGTLIRHRRRRAATR